MTYETLMLEAEERAVPSTRVRKMALPWIILALFTLSSIVALTVLLYEPSPPSLYQPALAKKLTLAERQKLDMDLVNEVTMQTNSRRFDEPESFRRRAAWVEEEAKSYVVADLIQQIIKVAVARPRYNVKAFNRLVDLGASSYPAASCIAEKLYRFHVIEKTKGWKYSRDQVTAMALRAKKTTTIQYAKE